VEETIERREIEELNSSVTKSFWGLLERQSAGVYQAFQNYQ
jgi:hypothetical protein